MIMPIPRQAMGETLRHHAKSATMAGTDHQPPVTPAAAPDVITLVILNPIDKGILK